MISSDQSRTVFVLDMFMLKGIFCSCVVKQLWGITWLNVFIRIQHPQFIVLSWWEMIKLSTVYGFEGPGEFTRLMFCVSTVSPCPCSKPLPSAWLIPSLTGDLCPLLQKSRIRCPVIKGTPRLMVTQASCCGVNGEKTRMRSTAAPLTTLSTLKSGTSFK